MSALGVFGHGIVERLLQHDTKRGHTLRSLRTSHVFAGPSQDTRYPARRAHTSKGGPGVRHRACERCAHCSPPKRTECALPCEKAGAPAEGAETKESSVVPNWERRRSSPSSTRLEHPLSSMRAHRPWKGPPLRIDQGKPSSDLSAKSGRLLVSQGAFHRQDGARVRITPRLRADIGLL